MTPRAVACQEFVGLITDYLEGVLPRDGVAAVEHYLSLCALCRRYLAQMRATIDVLGCLPVDALTDDAYDTLLKAFGAMAPAPDRSAPPITSGRVGPTDRARATARRAAANRGRNAICGRCPAGPPPRAPTVVASSAQIYSS